MEIRKLIFDGIEYNVFTDEELEKYVNEHSLSSSSPSQIAKDIKEGKREGYTKEEFFKKLREHGL